MEEQQIESIEKVTNRVYPLVSDRYKVVLVDAIVVIVMISVYSIVLDSIGVTSDLVKKVCFASLFLYEPLAVAFFGGTVGHWSGKLKVVKESDETSKISLMHSLLRTLTKHVLGIISIFTITAENRGKAIHDEAAGSLVLFTDEKNRVEKTSS
ncbi:MAG: RDD family protein [Bacteroidia bacterium]